MGVHCNRAFNIAVNGFDTKNLVTELVVNGTQCGSCLPQIEDEFLTRVRVRACVDLLVSTSLTCIYAKF